MQLAALWLVAVIVFVILEAVSYQIISIWFALGAVGAMVCAVFGAGFTAQATVFLVISVICVCFTRPVFKKMLGNKIVKTNVDAMIGAEALVTEDIDNISATGQAKVDGKLWTARSADGNAIKSGNTVTVERIEGVKLIVKSK